MNDKILITSHSHIIRLYQQLYPTIINLPGKCRWHQWRPIVLQCIDLKASPYDMISSPSSSLICFYFCFIFFQKIKHLSRRVALCYHLGFWGFFLYVIKLLGAAACMPSCQQPISLSFSFNFWTVVANL